MDVKIESLLNERSMITEKLKKLEDQLEIINDEIDNIQEDCYHDYITEYVTITIENKKHNVGFSECLKCGFQIIG